VAKDHHAGIDTALSDELSRNLSGHFRSAPSSPTDFTHSHAHSHMNGHRHGHQHGHEHGHEHECVSSAVANDGPSQSNHHSTSNHHSNSSNDRVSDRVSEVTLRQQQQQHDRDLQLLLNESIRAATRTCIWVFRCQITKNLAKAFHLWCRFVDSTTHAHTHTHAHTQSGAVRSPVISYESYSSAIKKDKGSNVHNKGGELHQQVNESERVSVSVTNRHPSATRALPAAAIGLTIQTDPTKYDALISPRSSRDPGRLISRNTSSSSNDCSDLSESDQAVQDLLNSSIVSAADSLHDEKRSLLRKW
jgi:hypothetical protein